MKTYLLLFTLIFWSANSLAVDTEQYFKTCSKAPFDINSACYLYYEGVLDITLPYEQRHICLHDNDKTIYKKVMKLSAEYLRAYPSEKITYASIIIRNSLLKLYPCP